MRLGSKHILVGSSKIQGLCPATGLQCAQQDLKLHNVVVTVSKATNGSYVAKQVFLVCDSKPSTVLFLGGRSSTYSRKHSRKLTDNLGKHCVASPRNVHVIEATHEKQVLLV